METKKITILVTEFEHRVYLTDAREASFQENNKFVAPVVLGDFVLGLHVNNQVFL